MFYEVQTQWLLDPIPCFFWQAINKRKLYYKRKCPGPWHWKLLDLKCSAAGDGVFLCVFLMRLYMKGENWRTCILIALVFVVVADVNILHCVVSILLKAVAKRFVCLNYFQIGLLFKPLHNPYSLENKSPAVVILCSTSQHFHSVIRDDGSFSNSMQEWVVIIPMNADDLWAQWTMVSSLLHKLKQ